MRGIAATALLALAVTGCVEGNPDGEGANVIATPAPEPNTDATTPTTSPAPSPTSTEPAAGTRQNPLPLGTVAQVQDWEVAITDVTLDATEQVAAENQFNDPPEEGRQFVMLTVEATYVGDESGDFGFDMTATFYGAAGNTFSWLRDAAV